MRGLFSAALILSVSLDVTAADDENLEERNLGKFGSWKLYAIQDTFAKKPMSPGLLAAKATGKGLLPGHIEFRIPKGEGMAIIARAPRYDGNDWGPIQQEPDPRQSQGRK